jgi:hypothetical protein
VSVWGVAVVRTYNLALDLVYDNGYIEIDPEQCGYTTFLGAAVPTPSPDAVLSVGSEASSVGQQKMHAAATEDAIGSGRGGQNY